MPIWRSSDRIQKPATQVETEDRPFDGVSADIKDWERTVWIAFSSTDEDHLVHGVQNATVVRTLLADEPVEMVLEMEAADGRKIYSRTYVARSVCPSACRISEPVEVSACTQLLHVTSRRPIRRSNGSVIERHLPSCMGGMFQSALRLTTLYPVKPSAFVGRPLPSARQEEGKTCLRRF